MSITWEEPPASARGGQTAREGKWSKVVEQLKANPGEWACVEPASKNTSLPHYLHKRYGLEASSRGNGDGTFKVYARWTGANGQG